MSRWFEQTAFRVGVVVIGGIIILLVGGLTMWHLADPRVGLSLVVWMSTLPSVLMALLFLVYARPWRYAADINRMLAGEAWAHWTYDAAEWRVGMDSDWRAYRRVTVITQGALAASAFLLLLWLITGLRELGLVVIGGFGVAMSLLILISQLVNPTRAVRRSTQGEIYISEHGVYRRPGGYLSLDATAGMKIDSVDVVDRPRPHLHIVALM